MCISANEREVWSLTIPRAIHEHAVKPRLSDYFPNAMKIIYADAFAKKAVGKGTFILIHERSSINTMLQAQV